MYRWFNQEDEWRIISNDPIDALPPGIYEIVEDMTGLHFDRVKLSEEPLIRLDDSACDQVLTDIENFWSKESLFKKHGFPFKRGILLHGPPGSGKTCITRLVMEDVIAKGGIVVKFDDVDAYRHGMEAFRKGWPDVPVVVMMEDIDEIYQYTNESELNSILDGTYDIQKVVYLATTNYLNTLAERVTNRPSRFDRRLEVGYPNIESRRAYLETLFHNDERDSYSIDEWSKLTKGFTFAHIKELFISVVLFGMEFDAVEKELRSMYPEDADLEGQEEEDVPLRECRQKAPLNCELHGTMCDGLAPFETFDDCQALPD